MTSRRWCTTLTGTAALLVSVGGCGQHSEPESPTAPPAPQQYGAVARSVHAELAGARLVIASNRDGVCIPPIASVYALDEDTLNVFLSDDVTDACSVGDRAACFDLPADLAVSAYLDLVITAPLTAYPEVSIERVSQTRTARWQCA